MERCEPCRIPVGALRIRKARCAGPSPYVRETALRPGRHLNCERSYRVTPSRSIVCVNASSPSRAERRCRGVSRRHPARPGRTRRGRKGTAARSPYSTHRSISLSGRASPRAYEPKSTTREISGLRAAVLATAARMSSREGILFCPLRFIEECRRKADLKRDAPLAQGPAVRTG